MPGFLSGVQGGMSGGLVGLIQKAISKKKKTGASDSDDPTGGFYGSEVTSYHKGGVVRKTGIARLRKGERVLTKTQYKRMKGK